jgi:hypothetical protein
MQGRANLVFAFFNGMAGGAFLKDFLALGSMTIGKCSGAEHCGGGNCNSKYFDRIHLQGLSLGMWRGAHAERNAKLSDSPRRVTQSKLDSSWNHYKSRKMITYRLSYSNSQVNKLRSINWLLGV